MHVLFALLGIAMLTSCATITRGNDQSITVLTDPEGAKCELRREGKVIAVAHPTPETVQLDKSRKSISITCQKDGFIEELKVMDSETEAMTVGNVILGGVIGVGVDAASGAMNKYPDSIEIELERRMQTRPDPEAEDAGDPTA